MDKQEGYIEVWFEPRGFGFIFQEGKQEKLFFHKTHIVSGVPQTGAYVKFDAGRSMRGLVALNVEIYRSREHAASVEALAQSTMKGQGGAL